MVRFSANLTINCNRSVLHYTLWLFLLRTANICKMIENCSRTSDYYTVTKIRYDLDLKSWACKRILCIDNSHFKQLPFLRLLVRVNAGLTSFYLKRITDIDFTSNKYRSGIIEVRIYSTVPNYWSSCMQQDFGNSEIIIILWCNFKVL